MEWILRSDRKPGDYINGLELAREFSVSTTAIREYLNRFSRFGLIEKRPNSGWIFRGFTTEFALPACGGEMRKVGEDISEVLDYIPGRFEVVRHIRPALSCRRCEKMVQSPMPSLPIERGQAGLIAADRTMVRYRSRRPPETELRARLRELANQRRPFGYRRLFILLRREGELSGVNRIYRLYREEGLTVRKRSARRRAVGTRTPILVEARVNARWSLTSSTTSSPLAGASAFSTSSAM